MFYELSEDKNKKEYYILCDMLFENDEIHTVGASVRSSRGYFYEIGSKLPQPYESLEQAKFYKNYILKNHENLHQLVYYGHKFNPKVDKLRIVVCRTTLEEVED